MMESSTTSPVKTKQPTPRQMPNFLIIGAAKAGTTALHAYIKQHPQVYVSHTKETNFFALEDQPLNFTGPGDDEAVNDFSVTSLEAYHAQYDGVTDEVALGEASPLYLYSERAPKRIAHYVPDAKIIVMLRNPAERAYASFLHLIRDNREPLRDFAQALKEEDERVAAGYEHIWHYRRLGFYYEQLSRYYAHFPAKNIKVYLQEDLKHDSDTLFRDLFEFLGVDPDFKPDTSLKLNVSGVPKNQALHSFLAKPNWFKSTFKYLIPDAMRHKLVTNVRQNNLEKPPLDPKVKRELTELYHEDTLKLQNLIDRDLSAWLKTPQNVD